MPGRWAAPPAPAMITLTPPSRAPLAKAASRSGVRCAETMRDVVGDAELVEGVGGFLQRRPVGLAAHDDGNGGERRVRPSVLRLGSRKGADYTGRLLRRKNGFRR